MTSASWNQAWKFWRVDVSQSQHTRKYFSYGENARYCLAAMDICLIGLFYPILYLFCSDRQTLPCIELHSQLKSWSRMLQMVLINYNWFRRFECATSVGVRKRSWPLLILTLALSFSLFFSMHCFSSTSVAHRKLIFGQSFNICFCLWVSFSVGCRIYPTCREFI